MCRFVTEPHVCIINWFPLLLSAYVRMYVLVVWNISVAQWWSFDSTHCLEHCHTALVFGGSVCVIGLNVITTVPSREVQRK